MGYDYKNITGKKVLVTGSTGFIGTHLCKRLFSLGCQVYGISRNFRNPAIDGDYEHFSSDLSDLGMVREIIGGVRPDYVFHLAGLPVGNRSYEFVLPTLESNLMSTLNLLLALTDEKCGKMILAGSLEEPAPGSNDIPSSPYAISKWAASQYGRMFQSLYQIPFVHLRLFMVYGPGRQDDKKLIPYVIKCLMEKRPPEMTSGSREIDWIFVEDVVEGLIRAAINTNVDGQTVDLGSGALISTRNLVEKIQQMMNSDTQLLFGSLEDRKMEQIRKADIERTYRQINWKPETSLDKGLARTIEYFQSEKALLKGDQTSPQD